MNINGTSPVRGLPANAQDRIAAQRASGGDFGRVLQSKINGVRFSAHAETRLKSRNIHMSDEMMGRLEKAVSDAADKGARDSLIMLSDMAFIVNIPNRTVVTAMDGKSLQNNIFTNIDSAVIAG